MPHNDQHFTKWSPLRPTSQRGAIDRNLVMGAVASVVVLACITYLSLSWNSVMGNERVVLQPTQAEIDAAKPHNDDLELLRAMTLPELEKELATRTRAAQIAATRNPSTVMPLQEAVERCHEVYNIARAKAQAEAPDEAPDAPAQPK